MSDDPAPRSERSGIGWMIRHGVAPNLLMFACLIGGFLMARQIKQEVFPDFELDMVTITVPYPGAGPEEVERGIVLVVEEAIRGTDGVKEVTATAREGMATIRAELFEGFNRQKAYQEIEQEVNRITTLPEDAEEPEVVLAAHWHEVLNVEVYGNVGELALREVVEQVRDRLLLDPDITQVSLEGVREYEVHVDVPQENLRAYGLTLEQIASRISATAIELPGGKVETRGGEILLRMTERREWAQEFANIPVVTSADGTSLCLRDIATVSDGFQDTDTLGTFNGARAMGVAVYRVGDQTPISVSDAARKVLAEMEPDLPPGVRCDVRYDRSDIYRQRVELLLRNAGMGLTLVMLLLAVFLEVRLAFWVTMGIPISFLGAFLFLPALGVTINMISLFAFIIALGIVVDDAIVVGENIYEYRQRGMGAIEASIRATRGVAVPVTYSILTNIVAFLPLLALPGMMGKIWAVIPLVVCTVFTISWLEAMFILPAHLAHAKTGGRTAVGRVVHHWQQAFSAAFMRWVARYYGPLLRTAVRWRYVTVAGALALLAGVAGYVFSGRIGMILMPRVEADYAFATARLPVGCPLSQATAVRDRLERAANAVAAENGGERLLEGVFAVIKENVIEMRAYLTPPEVRPISTSRLTDLWRARVGEIPGTESVRFQADRGGPGGGASLTVELSHRDIAVLDQASARLAEILDGFSNIKDIDDGYTPGKEQLNFTLRPEGYSLGLTVRDVARQVRNAFYGAEALRLQRGRSEIKVRVRFPESERVSEADIEDLMIHTAAGRDVPLRDVANVVRGRAYTDISRREGRRTVTVTADVVPMGDTNKVIATLNSDVLPQLARDFPGLGYGYEGRQADMAESMQRLFSLLILVLLTIFVMLALPFRSYIQPLIVMTAIPFGLVGAVFGHLIMGYDLSVISLMGILALSGVVVNDAIVLIDHANERRREGLSPFLAVTQAGIRRFRPIMLTTLTTFGGLAPMIFETSRQARFMIPMALSLGYGILFATTITLVLVPSLYLIAEDVKALAPSTRRARRVARSTASVATPLALALGIALTSAVWAGEAAGDRAHPEDPAVEQQTVSPNSFQGSDVERINQAIRAASPRGLRVVIPRRNKAEDGARDAWLLDSAILVRDNTTLELDNCHIKLSDRCRDNLIRSANCGLGITDIRPMQHVSIIGRGNVLLEGADRPRATGDSAKTLGRRTFGTDAGVEGESQTGDWRNIGILLAHVEHFRIENLQIRDSHCWAISLERCAFGSLRGIHFESAGFKMIDGARKTILNQDGLDLRQGCHDISIERITGATGDDLVALTNIRKAGAVAGSDTSTMVSAANCREGGLDDIRNIHLKQITGYSRGGHHVVRFLNAGGLRLCNIVLDGLIDTSPPGRPCKATLKIGDANPAWGGVTPLGDTHSLLLSNITGRSRHTILIAGSLTDSCISNVIRQADDGEPITYASGRKFVRNVQCTNVMRAGAAGDK